MLLLSTNGLELILFPLPGLDNRIHASSDLLNRTAVTNFVSTNDDALYGLIREELRPAILPGNGSARELRVES